MTVDRGISRHIVRFVDYGGDALYALKELPSQVAHREQDLLERMARNSIPAVAPAGLVDGRVDADTGDRLEAILITRFLEFSLPYRTLFERSPSEPSVDDLVDALVNLLVRLHVAGFAWGDCSLSNALFRRDAGRLAAYLVDAETAEHHPVLSDGQRLWDLQIAEENVAGELMDVAAGDGLARPVDPAEVASDLVARYTSLWAELVREETFSADERYLVDHRLARINELGFDVRHVTLLDSGDGYRLRIEPQVVEPGHHRRRLRSITGLDVQENQARRLLNDIAAYRAWAERVEGREIPDLVAASRWLTEVFSPTVAAVPPALRGKLEPAELFHQVLDHRWLRSVAEGRDVPTAEATASFVDEVLTRAPDERTVATLGMDQAEPGGPTITRPAPGS